VSHAGERAYCRPLRSNGQLCRPSWLSRRSNLAPGDLPIQWRRDPIPPLVGKWLQQSGSHGSRDILAPACDYRRALAFVVVDAWDGVPATKEIARREGLPGLRNRPTCRRQQMTPSISIFLGRRIVFVPFASVIATGWDRHVGSRFAAGEGICGGAGTCERGYDGCATPTESGRTSDGRRG
jgi:hypothetical protein